MNIADLLREHITEAAALLTAATVLWNFAARPLQKLNARLKDLDADTADLLWDRLQQEHEECVRRGWCSAAQKQRLIAMHRRYAARGRNHLAQSYEEELLSLPERQGGEQGAHTPERRKPT